MFPDAPNFLVFKSLCDPLPVVCGWKLMTSSKQQNAARVMDVTSEIQLERSAMSILLTLSLARLTCSL